MSLWSSFAGFSPYDSVPFFVHVPWWTGDHRHLLDVRDSSDLSNVLYDGIEVSSLVSTRHFGCEYVNDSLLAVACGKQIALVDCVDYMPQETLHGCLQCEGAVHKFCPLQLHPAHSPSSSVSLANGAVFAVCICGSRNSRNLVCIFDGASLNLLTEFVLSTPPFCSFCLTHDGRRLWIGELGAKVVCFDLMQMKQSCERKILQRGQVTCVTSIRPPNSHSELLCLCTSSDVMFWDHRSQGNLEFLAADGRPVKAFSDEERNLLFVYHRGNIVSVYDLRTRGNLRRFVVQDQYSDWATDIVRVRDDQYISANNSTSLSLWNSSGKILSQVKGLGSSTRAICVPPPGEGDDGGGPAVIGERLQFLLHDPGIRIRAWSVVVVLGGSVDEIRTWRWIFVERNAK